MSNTNYLAHFGTKGQKHGLRRHQSYETAPTRSGMVGQEVGEAARQSERLNRRDEQDDRNGPRRGPMQYEAKPSYNSPSDLAKASKKQSLKEKLRAKKAEKDAQNVEKNKAKWATNYKDLEKHKDAFTNKELEYALNRLNLTNRIKSDRWEQTRNLTQKGADTMKNLANASRSFVDIYNVVAGGYNTYQNYKSNKANKIDLMPKWNASSGQYNINNQNKSNSNNNNNKGGNKPNFNGNKNLKKKFKHSGMSATEYIAHFGIPGQKKGIRNFQSYETAPTRSGMVGEERGLAAKQASRLAKQEEKDNKYKDRLIKESDKYYSREENAHAKRADKFLKKATDTSNEKKSAKYTKAWYNETASRNNIEKIHKYANEHILNMTHDEIKKEKRQRGVDVLMDIGGVAAGFAMAAAGAPVAIYTFGAGRARQKNRRTKNALDYYKKKHGEDMTFDHIYHSNLSADDYIAHFGVPGQQWFKRHFQSYKTAPTRSGKVGEEIGLAAKQAERLGEDVDNDEVFKKDITEFKDLIKNKMIETESDVKYGQNMSQDHQKSADLGLNALDRMGDYNIGYEDHYRNEADHYRQGIRDWFVFEDQTIGMFTIANMVRKGATKQQINKLIDTAEEANGFKFNDKTGHYERKHGEEEYEYMPGIFQLSEGNWNDRLRSFADACLKEYEENKTEYFKVVGPQKKKLI